MTRDSAGDSNDDRVSFRLHNICPATALGDVGRLRPAACSTSTEPAGWSDLPMRRFLSWFKKASSARTAARRASPLRRASFRLEALEDRLVPAPIVWTNRLTATDTLTAAERAVVDAAIRTWQDIIVDFDSNPNNGVGSFNVSISGGSTSGLDLGGSTGASTDQYAANSAGTPTSARIRIDAGAGGAGTWYIDPNPGDNAEFTNVRTLFAANGGPAG